MDSNIIIRSTPQEKNLIRREAHMHEMNVSEYIRYLLEKERQKNETMA